MNLERASERAHNVSGSKTAARLYNDIEYELALGKPDPRLETAGEQALAHLDGRFPGIRDAARQIEEPPNLSRRAGDALQGVIRRAPQRQPTAHQCERERATLPRWSWNRLYAAIHTDPLRAAATITFVIIVVVKLWPYMMLAGIALVACRMYRQR